MKNSWSDFYIPLPKDHNKVHFKNCVCCKWTMLDNYNAKQNEAVVKQSLLNTLMQNADGNVYLLNFLKL